MNSAKKISICLVSHNSYGALTADHNKHIGGVEIQTNLMARWLISKGHNVTVIVWDEENGVRTNLNGIRVIPTCKHNSGLPGLRFFFPRWSSLIQALKTADADIYYHNCGEYVTGQVALWCKLNSKKFVYSVASDPDCDADLPMMKKLRERVLYRYGIKNADLIITQTKKQHQMLLDGFSLKSIIIPMPSKDISSVVNLKTKHHEFNVLWVGRLAPVKRLDRLIHIAERLEAIKFNVIGGGDQDLKYASDMISKMEQVDNITYLGRVKNEDMSKYYENASILCCTSDYEGFPNTFLEAWAHGMPIVSTVDPDGLIQSKGLGDYGREDDELIKSILQYRNDYDLYRTVGKAARDYFEQNHAESSALNKYLNSFQSIL